MVRVIGRDEDGISNALLQTMILGMAAVAAGLGGFWLLQWKVQNRRHDSPDAAEMPTCTLSQFCSTARADSLAGQFRHAQQAPEFNSRMSTPGGTNTVVRNRNEPTQYKTAMPVDNSTGGGGAASKIGRAHV